jgi:hypothetical protein
MKIPQKLNDKNESLQNNPFKLQTIQMFNSLIDCIKEQQKEIQALKNK